MVHQVARSHTRIGLATLRWLLVIALVAAGLVKLTAIEFERTNFAHFGYAPWFMYLIGVVEIVGALAMLARPSRGWGALLLAATMVGAAASHLRAGDGIGMATPALVLLVLLLVMVVSSGRDIMRDLRAIRSDRAESADARA